MGVFRAVKIPARLHSRHVHARAKHHATMRDSLDRATAYFYVKALDYGQNSLRLYGSRKGGSQSLAG